MKLLSSPTMVSQSMELLSSPSMVQLLRIQAFLDLLVGTLEATLILSVMLTIITNIVPAAIARWRMKKQVWLAVVAGVMLPMAAAAVLLSLYCTVAKKARDNSEALWEKVPELITAMALSTLFTHVWRVKWEMMLTQVTEDEQSRKSTFLTRFTVVVVREGLQIVILFGISGLERSWTANLITALVGALFGVMVGVGYLLATGNNHAAFKAYLGAATILLLVIAAGLFWRSVHEYKHTSCCNPEGNNLWSVLGLVCYGFAVLAFIFLHFKSRPKAERPPAKDAMAAPLLQSSC